MRCGGGSLRRVALGGPGTGYLGGAAVPLARLAVCGRLGGFFRSLKDMRKQPPRVAVFPASGRSWSAPRSMLFVGARPPLSFLVRRRDGSRPERGLAWSVCAWFLVLVCVLCAFVCG